MDLGFFVYWLPIESMLYYRTLTTVLFATVVVIFFYALTPSLRWDRGALYVSHYVRRHLAALGAVLLLLLAWSYRLDIYESLALWLGSWRRLLLLRSSHRYPGEHSGSRISPPAPRSWCSTSAGSDRCAPPR